MSDLEKEPSTRPQHRNFVRGNCIYVRVALRHLVTQTGRQNSRRPVQTHLATKLRDLTPKIPLTLTLCARITQHPQHQVARSTINKHHTRGQPQKPHYHLTLHNTHTNTCRITQQVSHWISKQQKCTKEHSQVHLVAELCFKWAPISERFVNSSLHLASYTT